MPRASDCEPNEDVLARSIRDAANSTSSRNQPQPARTIEVVSSCSSEVPDWIQAAPTTHSSLIVPATGDVFDISPAQENSECSSDSQHCLATVSTLESALDTLKKLETIRPFDRFEADAENERATPLQSETSEPDSFFEPETPPDTTSEQPTISPAIIGSSACGSSNEFGETLDRHKFRVRQSAPRSLESEQTDVVPVEAAGARPDTTDAAWAANVLAICGGLLMLAGILYVAVDMMFWF